MSVATSQSEQALHRIISYLDMAGIVITPLIEKRALALITESLDTHSDDLLRVCMARVPAFFELPERPLLCKTPSIHRGSLGYGDY